MGGVRTALYNYLFAKKHDGDFILRIEDTDSDRFVPGAEAYIIESLKWAGILPNEGIGYDWNGAPYATYRQSEKKHYREYVDKLIADGNAYYAFDTKDELDALRADAESKKKSFSYNYYTRESLNNSLRMSADDLKAKIDSGIPYVVRMKMPRGEDIKFTDLVRGAMLVKSHTIDDKVLFKSDGTPTYHLANVVDDYLMGITHVIRGEEWLPSAPLHVMLYKFLGWADVMPDFCHLPLILGPDGKKLSKRDGDKFGFPVFPLNWNDPATGETSSGYREKGYLPEAFINMIALLGWNPGNNVECITLDEMVAAFSFDKINKAGARFDLKKSEWFNKHYMMLADNVRLAELWSTIDDRIGGVLINGVFDKDYVASVVGLLKEKVTYLSLFWDNGRYFFMDPPADTLPKLSDYAGDMEGFSGVIGGWLLDKINRDDLHIDHDKAKRAFDYAVSASGVDARDAGRFLRYALTGMKVGPPIFDIIAVVGANTCFRRMEACIKMNAAIDTGS